MRISRSILLVIALNAYACAIDSRSWAAPGLRKAYDLGSLSTRIVPISLVEGRDALAVAPEALAHNNTLFNNLAPVVKTEDVVAGADPELIKGGLQGIPSPDTSIKDRPMEGEAVKKQLADIDKPIANEEVPEALEGKSPSDDGMGDSQESDAKHQNEAHKVLRMTPTSLESQMSGKGDESYTAAQTSQDSGSDKKPEDAPPVLLAAQASKEQMQKPAKEIADKSLPLAHEKQLEPATGLSTPTTVSDAAEEENVAPHVKEADAGSDGDAEDIENTQNPRLEEKGPTTPTTEDDIWWRLSHASRHTWRQRSTNKWNRPISTPRTFVLSTAGIDWFLFFGTLSIILPLHVSLLRLQSSTTLHVMVLAFWVFIAGAYGTMIFVRMGSSLGVDWMMGYLLELIFSLENIFILQFIVRAFGVPREINRRCLLLVACVQVVFQMFLYMGLSEWLKHIAALPIFLGICLILMGLSTIRGDSEEDDAVLHVGAPGSSSDAFQPIETVARLETGVVQVARTVLGDRLVTVTDDGEDFRLFGSSSHEKAAITVIGLQVLCLTIADLALEVDVTLTKIETIESHFVSFTSSALAGLAMPDLFFVARELFIRYHALKYGIGVLLVFFGAQMLLGPLVAIPAIASCAVILAVVLVCIGISACMDDVTSTAETTPEETSEGRLDMRKD